ncbi:hypothetical protein GGR52DRAFT_552377 [Hypoxylon sp. FL1284]|nr:hypothetical protein GGR52DRAFT_552377 [Hypoxylon sp. FL1284]
MPPPQNFVISDANLERDWDDLFATYWNSWKTPLQASGELTFVGIGTGGTEEDASFAVTRQHYLATALANPDQHWIKIEARNCDGHGPRRIIGGLAWMHVRDTHWSSAQREPDLDRLGLPGPGFDPGSERDGLSREFYAQMWRWRRRIMTTAHAYGQALWVLPEYRRTGAAMQLMDYWTHKIDELGLEAYLEGSFMGIPLYLKQGFVLVEHLTMVFHHDKPSPDWIRLVRDLQSRPVSIMWRPIDGKYAEGRTVLPWLGKPRQAKL